MYSIRVDSDVIHLPPSLFRKFKGKKAQLIETKEGSLIQPVNEKIVNVRGI